MWRRTGQMIALAGGGWRRNINVSVDKFVFRVHICQSASFRLFTTQNSTFMSKYILLTGLPMLKIDGFDGRQTDSISTGRRNLFTIKTLKSQKKIKLNRI